MKKLFLLFALLTILNGLVFLFREKFEYVRYSTYRDLYAPCGTDCREKWDDFLLPYSSEMQAEAKRLLQALRLDTLSNTLAKATAISHHLYSRFHRQAGYPQDVIHRADPLQAYKVLSADTAQRLFCGTYAQMFNFFCWCANVVCRSLEIYKPGDHHVLNEVYLPEQQRWVVVDLTNNTALAVADNRLLNTQDFVKAINKPASLKIFTASDTAWTPFERFETKDAILHYYDESHPVYYYHITYSGTVYKSTEKLKRYLLADYWYEIYSPSARPNILFYGKLFLALLWLILAGTIVFKLLTK